VREKMRERGMGREKEREERRERVERKRERERERERERIVKPRQNIYFIVFEELGLGQWWIRITMREDISTKLVCARSL